MKMKTGFFISAIGDEESDYRKWSDKILKNFIQPICRSLGYQITRADKVSTPGSISIDIVERLIKSDLVIADLTWSNPNVFYELAIRHISQKPTVHVIKKGEKIPFDVQDFRAVLLSTDLVESKSAKKELKKQIIEAEKRPMIYSNVSTFINLKNVIEGKAKNPDSKILSEIIAEIANLNLTYIDLDAKLDNILEKLTSNTNDIDKNEIAEIVKPRSTFTERRLAKYDSIKRYISENTVNNSKNN